MNAKSSIQGKSRALKQDSPPECPHSTPTPHCKSEASFQSAVILVPSQSARLFQTPEKEVLELG